MVLSMNHSKNVVQIISSGASFGGYMGNGTTSQLLSARFIFVGNDDVEGGRSNNDSKEAESSDVCRALQWEFPILINESKSMISMAALSYRIAGDMGDKFWNGYLLTYLRNIPE